MNCELKYGIICNLAICPETLEHTSTILQCVTIKIYFSITSGKFEFSTTGGLAVEMHNHAAVFIVKI